MNRQIKLVTPDAPPPKPVAAPDVNAVVERIVPVPLCTVKNRQSALITFVLIQP